MNAANTLPPLPAPFTVASTIKCTACGAPYEPACALAPNAQAPAASGELRERLIGTFTEGLHATYHCTRVWEAWSVGTMSEDDFEPVVESSTPEELADAVLELLAAPPSAQPVGDPMNLFKNFHRSLCARFGYVHDEKDWRRDLVSLEEHIAKSATPSPPVAAPEPVALKVGGRYNWKGQPERLVYIGRNWSGNGYWHQFEKVDTPNVVWCEVVDADLSRFEATIAAPQPLPGVIPVDEAEQIIDYFIAVFEGLFDAAVISTSAAEAQQCIDHFIETKLPTDRFGAFLKQGEQAYKDTLQGMRKVHAARAKEEEASAKHKAAAAAVKTANDAIKAAIEFLENDDARNLLGLFKIRVNGDLMTRWQVAAMLRLAQIGGVR